jgi:hypothetical protein
MSFAVVLDNLDATLEIHELISRYTQPSAVSIAVDSLVPSSVIPPMRQVAPWSSLMSTCEWYGSWRFLSLNTM